ncbi:Trm112 family protein [Occallatibacter riparius]|uniref:Trm112 family protein n=1 Tax=Occallatibacter riparius TaxID=1002689 RepID=A0A9J7BUD4_9BACT|nr:Trm112 family protein [Occallatibacter riparius]UWZ86248.1 hypothetical protein MOP44_09950 [Occallatibacter riparius]
MSADSSPSEFELRFAELRMLLACPVCQGELRIDGQSVVCVGCGRGYPIVDGIPVMIAQ